MREPPLRDEVLAAISGGERAFEHHLLARFLQAMDDDAMALDIAIRDRVRQRVESIAHLVQGRCKIIGAMTLAYAGERLEQAASRADWHDVVHAHAGVCRELVELRSEIARRLR
jgi:HPt (histidine-containing phosphotransfer) domain-containing protein